MSSSVDLDGERETVADVSVDSAEYRIRVWVSSKANMEDADQPE